MKLTSLMTAASAGALLLAGCTTSETSTTLAETSTAREAPAEAVAETVSWDAFMAEFLDGYFELNPTFAVSQGKHEFDGQ
ncbi:MAG: DUF885 domain-containing protein, partial [Henriciella sp.]